MKKIVILFLLVSLSQTTYAQLNIELLDQFSYDFNANDIWGWAAEDGTEYAIVGTTRGTSIVSLADPRNVVEVGFIPGASTSWRDIKTQGHYAYVTQDITDANEDVGIAIIDLSKLPGSIEYVYWRPQLDRGLLTDCHNIWIDEEGVCYLAGCDVNNGGIIMLDILTNPTEPSVIAYGPAVYAHDVYVKDNMMFASQLRSDLAIYDISDKQNITLVGQKQTPFDFTHNAWATDNNSIVFTTDERANAPVASYSVSANGEIEELDQFRPLGTINRGVIPHNVHVYKDNWVVTSYYTDGVVIIDGTRPANMIEIGNYDTFAGGDGGFNGAWGAYPYLPSGNLLVTDINSGLYVLKADYKQACWLEGTITDASNGDPIFDANISIITDELNEGQSDLAGKYATGLAQAGTYTVRYSKFGYESKTVQVTLNNGVLEVVDVQLEPLAVYAVAGATIEDGNGQAIPGARVILKADEVQYASISDLQGQFSMQNIVESTYDVYALAWGYLHKVMENVVINSNQSLTIELTPGYQDDFLIDLGWETEAADETTSGFWVLGEPVGTYVNSSTAANPEFDIEGDLGENCYMTGNGGGSSGTDDVDGGSVTLTSPVMDLTTYGEPVVSYYLWFQRFNSNQGATQDSFVVTVNNGSEEVTLEVLQDAQNNWRDQSAFHLRDWIDITSTMTISFTTSDFAPVGNAVEAAVDAFLVTDASVSSTADTDSFAGSLKLFPNPFQDAIQFEYDIQQNFRQGQIRVFNVIGQQLAAFDLDQARGRETLHWQGDAGVYLVQLSLDGKVVQTRKVIKQ